MEISFLGINCVRVTAKDLAILIDPYAKSSGLPDIKGNNNVTLLSSPSPEDAPIPAKSDMVIDRPGEYEIKGAMITGVPARLHIDEPSIPPGATVYAIVVEGIRIGYLGNIEPKLSNEQVEALGQVDVLVVPVGGHGLTLDATAATQIISQLEPKYVIPTHYDDEGAKFEVPQDKLEVFLKEIGAHSEPQARLRVTVKDLPVETTVVVLQRQGS
ncbi:MAG TPA: MBL fold metallo-hydrolase [Candidatus Polarisedimenticolaceae bacterium]|nr:MBL fold metallo-hydrolase [Candidatus Polarisedimenticolaceae bacterium]